jgi:arylsulfatase A-like enzyme
LRVLFIDIDTLRPDHMGCYGYKRNTTPNIDRVAAEGMVFENYYCSDAPCLPSRSALISGRFGLNTGAVGHGGTAADRRLLAASRGFMDSRDENNFHRIFRNAGLYTAAISSFPERHGAWWFNAGLYEWHNAGGYGMESGEQVLPLALDWLDRNKHRENWYLYLHLWDPHTPYRAPAEFGDPFKDEPLDTWITEDIFNGHVQRSGMHSLLDLGGLDGTADPKYPRHPYSISEYAGLKRLFDGYDCGIRYADHLLGQVFETLKKQGIYDDTAIILTSDHGENMGELGIYAEHCTADHITCRIPMIIKWPGGRVGRDSGLRYGLDLVPTVADMLGRERHREWDGESFAEVLTQGGRPGRESLVLSQQAISCQRSARFGDWIYIRTVRDSFQLFDSEMLFNLKDDPYEQYDVKTKYPEVCAQGARIIMDWLESNMKANPSCIDPMWTVWHEGGPFHAPDKDLPRYLERLEATGRGEAAKLLKERHGLS